MWKEIDGNRLNWSRWGTIPTITLNIMADVALVASMKAPHRVETNLLVSLPITNRFESWQETADRMN